MQMNQDGNVVGRVGALALIGLALWGVHRINCSAGYCPVMQKAALSCCTGEGQTAMAETPAPAPADAAAPAGQTAPK
jgi:hypothetical protein